MYFILALNIFELFRTQNKYFNLVKQIAESIKIEFVFITTNLIHEILIMIKPHEYVFITVL